MFPSISRLFLHWKGEPKSIAIWMGARVVHWHGEKKANQ